MKKKVKQYGEQIQLGTQDRRHAVKDFSMMLDNQVLSLYCWMQHHGHLSQIFFFKFFVTFVSLTLVLLFRLRRLYFSCWNNKGC